MDTPVGFPTRNRAPSPAPADGPLVDTFGRAHTDLRISVTDRCNFRCSYCMPAEDMTWLPREGILSYEEIERVARVLRGLGVTAVRGWIERSNEAGVPEGVHARLRIRLPLVDLGRVRGDLLLGEPTERRPELLVLLGEQEARGAHNLTS